MIISGICTDIDGTLLNENRALSHYTKSTLKELSNYTKIILASARMPTAMRYFQEELNILGNPLISYNGCHISTYDFEGKNRILFSRQIPLSICQEILNLNENSHISFYSDEKWFAPTMDKWTEREINNTRVMPIILKNQSTIHQLAKNKSGVHKVMCMGEEKDIFNLKNKLDIIYNKQISCYLSKPTYLEISPAMTCKASAMAFVFNSIYKIDLKNVIAFGDNNNDITMLQKAGLGVAVNNAKQEVKDIAKELTLSNLDDGVAVCLSKHFGLIT
jgi:Cof subfamily protein (haloacid dehalogenase superfamily)